MSGAIFGVLSILLNLGLILAVVFGVRKLFSSSKGRGMAHGIQDVFQYAITFGLLVIVAIGLSGLLSTLITTDPFLIRNQSALARNVSFTVVGLPLLIGMIVWIRRRFTLDANEGHGIAAILFMMVASLTSLAVSMGAAIGVLYWITGVSSYPADATAQLIVWLSIWIALWIIQTRVIPRNHSQVHYLVGSLVGLVASAVGLIRLIAAIVNELNDIVPEQLASTSAHPIKQALVSTVVGATVWGVYWIGRAMSSTRSPLWFGYVLLIGVGGGLATAVISASMVIYRVLVWFIGQPMPADAATYFKATPATSAAVVVGLLAWWYHRAMLGTKVERTEVSRIYSYLISGVGLISSAVGLTITLVALIEAVIKQTLLVGSGAVNTLLAALTAILVGVPVWLIYWIDIQRHVKSSPKDELTSPTRRTYLYALFGVGGIAAIISLLTGVFQFLDDLFNNRLDLNTLRDMRYAIGVLLSTASVALYHWLVYRHERDVEVHYGTRTKQVTLVGSANREITREIAQKSGARVQLLVRTDDLQTQWDTNRVVELIMRTDAQRMLIINDASGAFVIPISES